MKQLNVMNTTSIILTIAIGGTGLVVAVYTTIKGFIDAKRSVQERFSKNKSRHTILVK
jgi:hypothetical protein